MNRPTLGAYLMKIRAALTRPGNAVFLCIALPWVNPFAPGPSPAVIPFLVTSSCAGVLLLIWCQRLVRSGNSVLVVEVAATAWALVATFSSLIAMLQYFGFAGDYAPWVNSAAIGEAYANLRQRNQFASLVNIGLVGLLWRCALGQRTPVSSDSALHPPSGKWLSALPLLGAAILGAGNAASSSRTGLAQLLVIALLAIYWGQLRRRDVRYVLFTAGVTYALAAFMLPQLVGLDPTANGILARLHDGGPACASRLTLWGNVLHLIAQKPWTGWGWGELDYAHFITLYHGPRFCEILDNAHNLPLHLAVELGLPVALLACGLITWLVIRARPWRETDATRQMAWTILGLIMLHSMLEYPLWYGPFQMTLVLCIWLLWRKPTATQPSSDCTWPALIASLLIVTTAYVAWDYHRISQIYLAPEQRTDVYRDNTLDKLKASWLFRDQVRFAELTTSDVTQENAREINALAKEVLHFSPESRVVIKVIESALIVGRDDEAQFYLQRFKVAYPLEHERWAKGSASEDIE